VDTTPLARLIQPVLRRSQIRQRCRQLLRQLQTRRGVERPQELMSDIQCDLLFALAELCCSQICPGAPSPKIGVTTVIDYRLLQLYINIRRIVIEIEILTRPEDVVPGLPPSDTTPRVTGLNLGQERGSSEPPLRICGGTRT